MPYMLMNRLFPYVKNTIKPFKFLLTYESLVSLKRKSLPSAIQRLIKADLLRTILFFPCLILKQLLTVYHTG